MTELQKLYREKVIPEMMNKFGYKNPMAVPAIKKVVVSSSFGKETAGKTGAEREKIQNLVVQDITLISGQKAKTTKAKKSIAGFKLREGSEIGAVATLRRKRMWDFLERFIHLSLPRSRDFKGINPKSIDKKGNLNIGFKEHISFPEVFTEKEKTIIGLQVTVVVDAKNKEQGLELYKLLGFPMKD